MPKEAKQLPVPSHLYELDGRVWEVFDGQREPLSYRVAWNPVKQIEQGGK